jgi:soluble lytic murein transglycosylase-like protein
MIPRKRTTIPKPLKKKAVCVLTSSSLTPKIRRKCDTTQQIVFRVQLKKEHLWMTKTIVAVASILVMISIYIHAQAQVESTRQLEQLSTDYQVKDEINKILRENGLELSTSLEIAHTIVEESKKTDIPVEMYLAIIRKESEFRTDAVSSANAKGIMQIQGGTWNAYVKKHNLPFTKEDMFSPSANIIVASVILNDLHEHYTNAGYSGPVVWDYVLAAYYAGPASVRYGIKNYHRQYINKVKKYYREFGDQMEA